MVRSWFAARFPCPVRLPCAGAALFAGSAAANAVQPYGTNDAGGFRNVLPPGENGLDNLPQVLEYKSSKSIPKHFDDQQPLYENLLYGAPTLTDETDPELLQGRHLRRRAGRSRIDDRTETGGDDPPRQGLRDPAHLRRNARRHDVRRGLRGRRRPPLPDGRAAPHRPRRTRPPSSAARTPPPTRASGASRRTPKPTWKSRSTRWRPNTARPANRRSKTSTTTSKGSTPTSPPRISTRN